MIRHVYGRVAEDDSDEESAVIAQTAEDDSCAVINTNGTRNSRFARRMSLTCVCFFLVVFLVVGFTFFIGAVAFELPVLSTLAERYMTVSERFGVHYPARRRQDPPAYVKSAVLNVIQQGLLGECRAPGSVYFTGPEINAMHYIWVTTQPGCTLKLKDEYYCAVESALEHLPGIPLTIWIVQPPQAYVTAKITTSWWACDRLGHIPIPTRSGVRNVTTRPIVVTNRSILGRWYSEPENCFFLWTFKPRVPFAEISDFFRVLVLQQYGGLYTDFDFVLISPQIRFIEDGAGQEYTGVKSLGGHSVANSFLKFSIGSSALDDISMDMLKRIGDGWAPITFSYFGMASVTSTYLDHRIRKGCSHMAWTAYGRKTIFKMSEDECVDFETGVVISMHKKLQNRNNNTCQGVVNAFRLSCPVALSKWDSKHGIARV